MAPSFISNLCICCSGSGSIADDDEPCPLCDGAGLLYERNLDEDLPFVVAHIPGKGQGVLAVRRIEKGELILFESPLLTVIGVEAVRKKVRDNSESDDSLDTESMRLENEMAARDQDLSLLIAHALGQIDDRARDVFMSHADSFVSEDAVSLCDFQPGQCVEIADGVGGTVAGYIIGDQDGHSQRFIVQLGAEVWHDVDVSRIRAKSKCTIGGIFLTNAVSDGADDIAHMYSLTSMLNHSCSPNASVATFAQCRHVYANRVIEDGEEICISYIEDFCTGEDHASFRESVCRIAGSLNIDSRMLLIGLFRQQLYSKWGFWCSCFRCEAVTSAADEALGKWCETWCAFEENKISNIDRANGHQRFYHQLQ